MELKSGIHSSLEKNVFLTINNLQAALKDISDEIKIWRTKYYYVQIEEAGKGNNGEISTQYYYKLNAHNDDGKIITVEFNSSKNFGIGTTLRLKVNRANKKKINTISSFEEL
ncbi:YxeA family protein [Bacillus sp. JJ722]|uniref:YxeA family protein n=1 Tax=Bacillus sp. JJ722 TaxID=3122973 RepID=UPI002FFEFA2C